MKNILFGIGGVVLCLLVGFAGYNLNSNDGYGGVDIANDYTATTTGGNLVNAPKPLLVTGQGALGSVTITGANTGVLDFYNATTTNVNLRTGQTPTSSIYVASIPASTAAGTYVFDEWVNVGLLLDASGSLPTSTITYRQY